MKLRQSHHLRLHWALPGLLMLWHWTRFLLAPEALAALAVVNKASSCQYLSKRPACPEKAD